MDGALIGFSFLSLCHPKSIFFVCLFSALILVFFFLQLYFSLPPTYFFSLCFFFGGNFIFSPPAPIFFSFFETFPSHPPTTPRQPTHLYIWIKNRLFPIYLLTYKFKMCYFHPHPPNHPTTNLHTNTLNRFLPNPTYMATPTYMVAIAIHPQWSPTMRKK